MITRKKSMIIDYNEETRHRLNLLKIRKQKNDFRGKLLFHKLQHERARVYNLASGASRNSAIKRPCSRYSLDRGKWRALVNRPRPFDPETRPQARCTEITRRNYAWNYISTELT